MKLTGKTIASLTLPPGKSDCVFWDDDLAGYGRRLRSGGSAKFIFRYKIGGAQRTMTLGDLPEPEARKLAIRIHARVKLGEDPAGDRNAVKVRASETFEAALDPYLKRQRERLRPRSISEVERHLGVYCKPLHKRQLVEIDRRGVAMLLAQIAQTRGPGASDRTRTSLHSFFVWAQREGLADDNPVSATNKALNHRPRERVLTDVELRDIWSELGKDDYGAIVKLLFLTGARRDEIGLLSRAEIDLDRALISLPGARTKNHRPFDLPLSSPACTILAARAPRTGSDFVFGKGVGGFSGWSACKRRLDERIAASRKAEGKLPLEPWVLHDARRTMSTIMHERLSIQPHVVEACLNHISGHQAGVAGVYNRAAYSAEKRHALDRWAEHVLDVVEGREAKITSLRHG